jgi:hypothetical protein
MVNSSSSVGILDWWRLWVESIKNNTFGTEVKPSRLVLTFRRAANHCKLS